MISFKVLSYRLYVGHRLKRKREKGFDRGGKMKEQAFKVFFLSFLARERKGGS